jgi:hypothetical protein
MKDVCPGLVAIVAFAGCTAATVGGGEPAPPVAPALATSSAIGPVPVRAVDEAPRQPMHASLDLTITDSTGCTPFAVPANKRLVIEHISAKVFTPTGTRVDLETFHTLGGSGQYHYLVPVFFATQAHLYSNGDLYKVSEQTRLYVDANTKFYACTFNNSSPKASGHLAISGYFVDVP